MVNTRGQKEFMGTFLELILVLSFPYLKQIIMFEDKGSSQLKPITVISHVSNPFYDLFWGSYEAKPMFSMGHFCQKLEIQ